MEPVDCPETLVINYLYSLRNNPEERSFRADFSVKLPKNIFFRF